MKLKLQLFVFLVLSGTSGLYAQKYLNTEEANVTKMFQGVTFSSQKTLLENLTEVDGFGTFASVVEVQGESLFKENFMGTVFVVLDSGFNIESEDGKEADVDLSDPITQKEILHFLTVPGRIDEHAIRKAIEKGGGTAYFRTSSGEKLRVKLSGEEIILVDNSGKSAKIVASDFYHKNGFFHIIDSLVSPETTE